MNLRALKSSGGLLLALAALIAIAVALFDWNWLKGPIERKVMDKTGRQLIIGGDLKVSLGWPLFYVDAARVTFANPPWAREQHMLAADHVRLALDPWALLFARISIPAAELRHPVIVLKKSADGRANWRIDKEQRVANTDFHIGVIRLDQGKLAFSDSSQDTIIAADVSTANAGRGIGATALADAGLVFSARGKFKGFSLVAHGSGGPALALGAEGAPYPLAFEATIGRTWLKAEGTVTGLLSLAAIDMQLALKGDSLAQLLPQLGLALPETHAYDLNGRLVHDDHMWRYGKFAGTIGKSDLAGTLQVDSGEARAFLHGELVSVRLDFADLGPMVGATPAPVKPAAAPERAGQSSGGAAPAAAAPRAPPAGARVLPHEPYNVEHWKTLDAEVKFSAQTIHRAQELPLNDLVTTIKLRDSVLTLDPLDFGTAGGHLDGAITLDGRQDPIQASARLHARAILLAKMLPTIKLADQSIGQMNGELDLAGTGNAVDAMLATANGKVALVIGEGRISRLLLEQMGLHLPEIITLKIAGDKLVGVRCGIADFTVRRGVMAANELVLDTDVTTVEGRGTIDLARESLDLTLAPSTKNTSLVALRSPIHVRGSFGHPEVGIDAFRVAARGLGAVALGLINPVLALIPLVEPGPGKESDCGRLISQAQVRPGKAPRTTAGTRSTAVPAAHARSEAARR